MSNLRGFSDRLGIAIAQSGYSQSEVAKRIGCTYVNLHKWLIGAYMPNAYYLGKICVLCEVSADWLLLGEDK